ncbi:hypothetical protein [Chamaesiphon minutus]|uniref:Uncharacterized protein n=1 Tax=Chamaesiphon minutus (strain ATCC 27169 / PCC 6605) TaxID=1173020 RepID=K9UDA5_CHAP6|nr:hypothetical protein [Chamaesiphon minutus]AFY92194.1 hypothetical protein Cha6605_0939 [Chamaesiphon minutus PCC 6605]
MKLATLVTGIAMVGLVSVGNLTTHNTSPSVSIGVVASAAEGPTVQEKIALVTKNKGQIGGGDQLRRFFYGDLEPLGVQPGGAGMVVNLYNKANNVTFSYCATYDVVVAVRKGKVAMFTAGEVK